MDKNGRKSKGSILTKIVQQIQLMRKELQNEKHIDAWWEKELTFAQFVGTERLKHDYTVLFYHIIKEKPRIKQDFIKLQGYIKDSEFRRGKTIFELLTAQWNFVEHMLELIEQNVAIIKELELIEKKNIKNQVVINSEQYLRFQQLRKLLYNGEFKYLATIFKLEKEINYKEVRLNKHEISREKNEVFTFLKSQDMLKRLQIHLNYQFKYIDAIENYYISVVEHATRSEMREMIGEEREMETAELGHNVKSLLPVVISIQSLIQLFVHNSNEEMRHVLTMEKIFKQQRLKNVKLMDLTQKEISLEKLEQEYEQALRKVIKNKPK